MAKPSLVKPPLNTKEKKKFSTIIVGHMLFAVTENKNS